MHYLNFCSTFKVNLDLTNYVLWPKMVYTPLIILHAHVNQPGLSDCLWLYCLICENLLCLILLGFWSGCPLENICYGLSAAPSLPPLVPTHKHAILFNVGNIPKPYPEHFHDVWDSHHVRMPCSRQCLYPIVDSESKLIPRWDLIRQTLKKQIRNSHELEEAIMTYNSVYSKKWKFDGLHTYFSKLSGEITSLFFSKTLPNLINLALKLPEIITSAIPLLKKQGRYAISMSQHQVACLLANAFLCTLPRRNSTSHSSEYSSFPSINFNTLYSSDAPGT